MSVSFRRRVLYLPGFDPIPPRRYRELYRREGPEQARISGYRIGTGRSDDDSGRFGWSVEGQFGADLTAAQIEVLIWADLVQKSMKSGIAGTYLQLVRTAWTYFASGAIRRLMRLRLAPLLAAFYPVAVLLAQLLAACLLGAGIGWLVSIWLGWPVGLIAALATVWGMLVWFKSLDHKLFAYYLMHDYAFTAQHGGAYPPELEARLAQFTDRLAEVLNSDLDEVLVVGHSSGAYLGVSLLADLIRSGRVPENGPALALLTLGHVVPMASFLPRSQRLRADLALVSESPDLFWLDVSAPGDACCFGLCDPVAVTGVAGPDQRWPLVISAAFTRTLSPQRQKELRNRWFRKHFQYLCAFDRPGDYDYFAITAGPLTLAERFAGRPPSPGRITTPAGKGLA